MFVLIWINFFFFFFLPVTDTIQNALLKNYYQKPKYTTTTTTTTTYNAGMSGYLETSPPPSYHFISHGFNWRTNWFAVYKVILNEIFGVMAGLQHIIRVYVTFDIQPITITNLMGKCKLDRIITTHTHTLYPFLFFFFFLKIECKRD